MKKVIIFLTLLFVLITPISAQITNNSQSEEPIKKLNNLLSDNKVITIPDAFRFFSTNILRIETELTLPTLIIFTTLFIILILIIASILQYTPFLNGKITRWISAVIITMLISISGAVKQMAIFFLDLGNFFNIFKEWSALALLFSIVIVILLSYGASKLIKIIGKKAGLDKADYEGKNLNTLRKISKIEANSIKEY